MKKNFQKVFLDKVYMMIKNKKKNQQMFLKQLILKIQKFFSMLKQETQNQKEQKLNYSKIKYQKPQKISDVFAQEKKVKN